MIRDAHGNGLLEVLKVSERGLGRLQPLTCAVVIVQRDRRTLLVFNRKKRHWELPGGGMDPGETARACAARELHEESGMACDSVALRFLAGMAIVAGATAGRDARLEYGGVFLAEAQPGPRFVPNDEIAAVTWWNPADTLPGVCDIDRALVSFAGRFLSSGV